jgi:hypothetical protein
MNFKEAHMQKKTETPLYARVAPPSEPACFQNPVFKQCIDDIFSVFAAYSADMSVFVSGGCLSRTYLDTCMSEGHKSSFGDIDFKVPSCSQDDLKWFAFNYNKFTDKQLFCPSPLAAAFNALLYYGGVLEKVYYKGNDASARLVINIKWRGVAVDFVLFKETLIEHAMKVDLSVSAGFYNPAWKEIFFPCDGFLEYNQYGLGEPCDRSAKDFMNKELNLVFPERFWDVFDEDPIRILRIVQAVSRSDYTLSTVLRQSITDYLYSKRGVTFSKINPDRLYYNLKSLFFSGHAVKNLNTLKELNLLDVLFLNRSDLSVEEKELSDYLIQVVSILSDKDHLLPPCLLFYAVYWNAIKYRPYDQNLIVDLSNGKIRLPANNNGLDRKEIFNETLHKNNIEYLQTREKEYKGHQKYESSSDGKIDANSQLFGDALNNPISVVVSPSPIPADENILFPLNDLPGATEPRPLGSGNPGAFGPCSESTNETMITPQKSNNKKAKREKKVDNPLIVDEYSIYKERCQQAIALLDSKKYKEAEKVFNDAIKLNSAWSEAYCGLGQVCQKLAEKYNADIASVVSRLNLLKENAKKNKTNIEKYTKDHEDYLKQQDEKYHEAVTYYEKALARSARCEQAVTALKKIGEFHAPALGKENTVEIDTVIPFTMKSPLDAPKSTILAPSKKKEKKASSKQKIDKQLPLSASDDKQDLPEQQNRNQYLLQKAQQEENAGNDLKAIEWYKQSFTEGKSLASGYKCIFLYKKLRRYQDALIYATKLIAISEEEHSRVYDNQSIREEKPLNNYQYHHSYALYQRGKVYLKLKNSREAAADFNSMESNTEGNNVDVTLIDIVIRSYIKLGQHYCSLAYESPSLSQPYYATLMQDRYQKVLDLITRREIVNDDLWNEIYLGLGDVERFNNNFDGVVDGAKGAKFYYEKVLETIGVNIDKDAYPFECIDQKFYQYAEHVGGHLVNILSERVLRKQPFLLSENDKYLLKLADEACLGSTVFSRIHRKIDLPPSCIMGLKISLILGKYDDAISKIEHIMARDVKQTQCSLRELFLLIGVCHEEKLNYDTAMQWYAKAQQPRYDDDTDKYKEWTALAETVCIRVAKSKKESIKKQKLLLKGAELVKARAFSLMENGKRAQIEGRFDDAQSHYRGYLALACAAASDPTTSASQLVIYDLFNKFAHNIINQDVIEDAINNVLFTENEVTPLPDFNYLDLLNDIYSEAVKYTSDAHLNLMFITILRKDYNGAIERIKILIDKKIIDVRSSTRDLHYICGKMHELKADSVGAKAYYEVSGNSAGYSDDKESFSIVRTASISRLEKIIGDEPAGVLNGNLSLAETKEGTNPNRLFSERRQIPVADQYCSAIQHSEISSNTMDGDEALHKENINYLIACEMDEYSFYKKHCQNASVLLDSKKYKEAEKVEELASVLVSNEVDPCEQQQNRNQDMLRKAQQEENAGNDLKAIECYKQLFIQGHSLASGYKCIKLYKKLEEHHKAKGYADKLVSISEEEYARVYKHQTIMQEKPFDDYQYHRYYALYQRGKLFLKLKQIIPASQDLDIIIALLQDPGNKLDSALFELAIRACVKLGRYNCLMAYGTELVEIRDIYIRDFKEYYQLAENAMKTMDCNHYLRSDVYLGLGDVERLLGNVNNTKFYYERALNIIDVNIDNLYCPFDSIWERLCKYAVHVGEFLVDKLSTKVLSQHRFTLSEQEHYLLQLLNDVCCSSVVYSNRAFNGSQGATFQKSHIIKIKIALIYKRYDDAISQINGLLQGDFKKTNCCQREILLFLGLCYEQKLDYEQAISYYHKAQQLERYRDDNSHYNDLVSLAHVAGKRMAACIKQSKKQVTVTLFPSTQRAVLPPEHSLVEATRIETVTLEEKAEALFNLSVAQKAQQEGNITLAEQAYRVYLSYAGRVAQEDLQANAQVNIYGLFSQFANKIIEVKRIFVAIDKVIFNTKNSVMPIIEPEYLRLLNDIYSEAVKYSPSANLDLIFMAAFTQQYDSAIQRIEAMVTDKIADARCKTRYLLLMCGKLHEMKGDFANAAKYYNHAADKQAYPDDGPFCLKIANYSNMCSRSMRTQVLASLNEESSQHDLDSSACVSQSTPQSTNTMTGTFFNQTGTPDLELSTNSQKPIDFNFNLS